VLSLLAFRACACVHVCCIHMCHVYAEGVGIRDQGSGPDLHMHVCIHVHVYVYILEYLCRFL
jgi:hypothetical protein